MMMARAYSEADKERLTAALLNAARDLFGQYGLAKTSISDLAGAVGIANSTFYQFFPSKEALFFAVIGQDRAESQARIMAASFEAYPDDPAAAMAAFLRATLAEIDANPLARRLLDGDEFRALAHRLTPEQVAAQRAASLDPILPYLTAYQTRGLLVAEPPAVIAAAVRALVFLALHRDEIGAGEYPAVMDVLISAVTDGLTRPAAFEGE
jgi:TetR/AcrR family transcriptional regulator